MFIVNGGVAPGFFEQVVVLILSDIKIQVYFRCTAQSVIGCIAIAENLEFIDGFRKIGNRL